MNLLYFKTLWGHEGSITEAVSLAKDEGFQGIEGPVPEDSDLRKEFEDVIGASGLEFIAEVTTGGNYVPDPTRSPAQHLDDLRRGLERSLPLTPLLANTQAGLDAWPIREQIRFHKSIVDIQSEFELLITVETHRSRSTFNPWNTAEIAREVPGLRLNLDFSHWCVVAERLVMNDDPDMLAFLASRCRHMHARVGYDQGPQVPHPAAPEHRADLLSHLGWWQTLLDQAIQEGRERFTITPEFGTDGYLHRLPFTRAPVADLWETNVWMKNFLEAHLTVDKTM